MRFGDIIQTDEPGQEPFPGWTAEGLGIAIRASSGEFNTSETWWTWHIRIALLMSAVVLVGVALAGSTRMMPRRNVRLSSAPND